jgi:hypothetical protein
MLHSVCIARNKTEKVLIEGSINSVVMESPGFFFDLLLLEKYFDKFRFFKRTLLDV